MASEAYLNIMEKGGDKTRSKTRKSQKGGTAPVDFQTRPGVDGVHGSFPQYLTNGLSFYNTINQEGMFKGCGIEDITPSVPASMGSNKALGGGGRMFTPTVPPSVGQDAENAMAGRPLGLSSLAENNPLAGKYI
jgi:hypothetical protein